MSKYLDENGVLYFWQKIKLKLADKVDVVSGKGLSTNDYTDSEKSKVAASIVSISGDGTSTTITYTTNGGTSGSFTTKDTTYSTMGGASSSAAGSTGLVPAPSAGANLQFLRGDGQWADVSTSDTMVNVTLAQTTKAYLLATTTTPTATATGTTAVGDTGVYLDTTSGGLTAGSFTGSGANLTSLNGSNIVSGTVPAARLPAATTSTQGAMSAADKTKLDAFSSASDYALKSDITNMYKYKGSVATVSDLPATGNTAGDVYDVIESGMNYAWTGTAWDALGEIFTITSISNAEIDIIVAT